MEKETIVSCCYKATRDALCDMAENEMCAVTKTTGPGGLCILIQNSYGSPKITKDGYSVVNAMKFKDKLKSLAYEIFSKSCSDTNKEAGDGTTYNINILREAIPSLYALCASVFDLEAGYNFAIKFVSDMLGKISRKVNLEGNDIMKIATISANGDTIVGKAIADAMKKVGAEGVITVEESKSVGTTIEYKSGMNLDRGYISPYFSTNPEKMICELENPYILVTSKKITTIDQILKVLEGVAKSGRPLFIIADDVEGEALTTLIINRIQGRIKVCAIKAPGFGDKRTAMLEDLAISTGAQVIAEETGDELKDIGCAPGVIGSAGRVIVTKDSTTIIDGAGDKTDVEARIKLIKLQISDTDSEYEKEKLQERLAKLAGGVAVIKVGGTTELEAKELKDRIEDALNAVRAAVAEGFVPGGGVTQLAIKYLALDEIEKDSTLSRGAKLVAERIFDAFAVNIKHIVSNTGASADVVINTLMEQFKRDNLSTSSININKVYDALNRSYVNAYDSVIDPAKVIRVAFMNAINTVYMLLRTGGVIYFANEEKTASATPAGMGGMGGMGGMDY